jgi:hypothetical protein
VNVCDDCTGNAFLNAGQRDFTNRYCPSSEGIFPVHTPIRTPAHPRIQAKVLDLMVRITGSGYQRMISTFLSRVVPEAH